MKSLLMLLLLSSVTLYAESEAEVLRIEGEIEKPEAYFILQRKSFDFLNNVDMSLDTNFVELIESSVSSQVF